MHLHYRNCLWGISTVHLEVSSVVVSQQVVRKNADKTNWRQTRSDSCLLTQFPGFVISEIMPTPIHTVCLSSCCLTGLTFAVHKAKFHCSVPFTVSHRSITALLFFFPSFSIHPFFFLGLPDSPCILMCDENIRATCC